jgi:hypothetical protein
MFHTFMDGKTLPRNFSPLLRPKSVHSLFWRVRTEFYCFALKISLICKIDGPLVATVDFFTGYIIEIFYILNDAEDKKKLWVTKNSRPKDHGISLFRTRFLKHVPQNF